ncbi:Imm1 family immunity protein [Actinokineospora auranticolor]|uniref:Immunity protein Imm1 of predicted polymorphic toxin system n=1 Tax=Actinokineospora auranticolor TaxID=155976 RepID=A0A2S6GNS4_9PSEU|nr:Imm1 family immunity protein [Actinokineospora auranticolor]PPK66892.1 immunity protein Imm1 of predicted polymorphic toxin system [Actinokineospora auranticolor]
MPFTAHWDTYAPDEVPGEEEFTAESPGDVDRLVALLSDPHASAATIVHAGRAEVVSPYSGETVPDHLLWALVHSGFGYLHYHDPDHVSCVPVGDPTSAHHHYDYTDFEAGSGLPVDVFTKALKQFLATATRPTVVQWREG